MAGKELLYLKQRQATWLEGNVQNFVSGFVFRSLPPVVAEADASSENGPHFARRRSWHQLERNGKRSFPHSKISYQSFSSLSSLPSKNIAS